MVGESPTACAAADVPSSPLDGSASTPSGKFRKEGGTEIVYAENWLAARALIGPCLETLGRLKYLDQVVAKQFEPGPGLTVALMAATLAGGSPRVRLAMSCHAVDYESVHLGPVVGSPDEISDLGSCFELLSAVLGRLHEQGVRFVRYAALPDAVTSALLGLLGFRDAVPDAEATREGVLEFSVAITRLRRSLGLLPGQTHKLERLASLMAVVQLGTPWRAAGTAGRVTTRPRTVARQVQ